MISLYLVIITAGLAAEANFAVTPSKCPELLNVPSDTASVLFAGVVQDLLAPDENGNYGAVLTLEEVLLGEDVMEDYLAAKYSDDRNVISVYGFGSSNCMMEVVKEEEYLVSVNVIEGRLVLHYDGISSPVILLYTNSTLNRHKKQTTISDPQCCEDGVDHTKGTQKLCPSIPEAKDCDVDYAICCRCCYFAGATGTSCMQFANRFNGHCFNVYTECCYDVLGITTTSISPTPTPSPTTSDVPTSTSLVMTTSLVTPTPSPPPPTLIISGQVSGPDIGLPPVPVKITYLLDGSEDVQWEITVPEGVNLTNYGVLFPVCLPPLQFLTTDESVNANFFNGLFSSVAMVTSNDTSFTLNITGTGLTTNGSITTVNFEAVAFGDFDLTTYPADLSTVSYSYYVEEDEPGRVIMSGNIGDDDIPLSVMFNYSPTTDEVPFDDRQFGIDQSNVSVEDDGSTLRFTSTSSLLRLLPTPAVCAAGNLTTPYIDFTTIKAAREIVFEEDRPTLWQINIPSDSEVEEYYRIIPLLISPVSLAFSSDVVDVMGENFFVNATLQTDDHTFVLGFTSVGIVDSTEYDNLEVLQFNTEGSGSLLETFSRDSRGRSYTLLFKEDTPGKVFATTTIGRHRLRLEFTYDNKDDKPRFQDVSLTMSHTSLSIDNNTLSFNLSSTLKNWNSSCPEGSGGYRCQVCQGGYFGRPKRNWPCRRCRCNGHSDGCRRRSGRCVGCGDNTKGRNCQFCADMYYGDAINDVCKSCDCDQDGSQDLTCNRESGQCNCHDGITNRTCNSCINEGFWGPKDGQCRNCTCVPDNTIECVQQTGECVCREGWTGDNCSVQVSCIPLDGPDIGVIDCTGSVYGDTCSFTCDDGYELTGSDTRTCQSDGNWNGSEAGCEQVSCPPLTTPDDGTYNCTMGGDGAHVVGDTCTLTCDDGFEPSDSISRQCDNDGSWSGSDPTCDRVSCTPLDGPDNGVIDCTGSVYGDTCSFTCDDGYELIGSDTRTCQSDGNWNGSEAKCEQVPPTLIISGQISGPDIGLPPVPVKITYLLDGSEDVQWEITVPEGVNLTNYGVLFPVCLPPLQFLTTDESVNANFFNGLFSSIAMVTSNDTSFILNITGTGLTTNGSITTVNFEAVAFGDFDLTTYPADLSTVSYSYYVEEDEPGRVIMSGNIGDDDIPLSVMFNYSPTTDGVPFDDRQFGIDQSNVSVEDDGSTLRFTSTSSLLRLLPTPAVCAAGNLTTPYIDFTTIKAAREIVFEDDRPTLWQINIPSDSEVEEYYRIIPLLISPVSLAFSSDVVDVMGENFFVNATLQTGDHTFVLGFTSVGIVDSTEYDNLEVLQFNTDGSGSLLESFSRDSRARSYTLLFKEDTPGKVFATTTIGRHRLRLEFTYDNKDDKPRFQDVSLTMSHTSLSIDNNTLSFNLSSTLKNWNSSCPEGSGGYRCQVCQGGYFGRPKRNRPCRRCRCNGHSDGCRRRSGRCIGCGDNTKGRNCQFCADMFYGDAINDVCKSCDCDQDGSQDLTCNRESGQCNCHDGITNRTCNSCINEGFWGPKDGQCRNCTCVPDNTVECVQQTGECMCRGGWTGDNCSVQVSCPPLDGPDNGVIDCTGSVYGDTCSFTCDDGYELTGSDTRTCQSDGNWNGSEAECEQVTCPPLTTPDDGTYNCTMGGDGAHVVGDTCTLTCDDGFEPSDSINRQCDNDGSWSGSDPTCDRVSCTPLDGPDNGVIDCTGSVYGDTCSFTCDDGYELTGSDTRTCQSDGNWNGSEAECKQVPPTLIISGQVSGPDIGLPPVPVKITYLLDGSEDVQWEIAVPEGINLTNYGVLFPVCLPPLQFLTTDESVNANFFNGLFSSVAMVTSNDTSFILNITGTGLTTNGSITTVNFEAVAFGDFDLTTYPADLSTVSYSYYVEEDEPGRVIMSGNIGDDDIPLSVMFNYSPTTDEVPFDDRQFGIDQSNVSVEDDGSTLRFTSTSSLLRLLPTPAVCAAGNLTTPYIDFTTIKAAREIVFEDDRPTLWQINIPSDSEVEEYYRIIPLLISPVSLAFSSDVVDVMGENFFVNATLQTDDHTFVLSFTSVGIVDSTEYDNLEVLQFNTDGSGSLLESFSRDSRGRSYTLLFKEDTPGKVFATTTIGRHRLRLEFTYDNKDDKPRFQDVSLTMSHTSLSIDNNTLSFNLSSTLKNWNSSCPEGSGGYRCRVCQGGYFGRPKRNRPCRRCRCNGHSDRCRRRSGRCIGCGDNTKGRNCQFCVDMFYGDAINDVCKSCDCDQDGSQDLTCNRESGQCKCHDGITNRTCNSCINEGFWGPKDGQCRNCTCVPDNTIECVQETGECVCREGWTGDNCSVQVSCTPLDGPDNGVIDCTGSVYGDTCSFTCDDGYELTGSDTRTCQSDGNWNGTEAGCEQVSCPPLTTPDDGTYNCTMGGDGAHVVGDTCTLTCDDGFEPSDTTSRQCDNDGSWSGSDPTCDRVSCPPLDGPDNGVVDCTGSVYGDTCSFTCDDGYELTGSDTRTCQSDGNWNGTEAGCEQVTCPPLTTPDDGTYNCTMGGDGAHVVGDTCTLTCDDGFEPSDSISRQCDNDGSWSGSDPTCDRVSCPPLDGPDNGVIDCTGIVYGDTCSFTCDDGYELTGSDTRTCQSDGNWNGSEAECEQVPPTLIISGQVSGPDIGLPPVPVKITYLLDGSEDVQWEITVPEGVNLTNYGVLFPVSLLPSLQFLTTDESVNANFFNGLFSSVAMVTSNDTSFTLNITGTGLTTNGSITTVNFEAVAFGDFDLTTYPADLSTVSYSYYVEENEPGRVIMSGNIGDDDIPLSVMFNYSPTTDEVPFDDRQFGIDQSNVSVEDDGSTPRFTSTSSLLRLLPTPAVCAAGNLTTPYIDFTTIKAAREIVFEDDRPTLWQINIPSGSEVEEYYRIIPLLISPVSLAFSSDVVDVMGENFFVNATLQTDDHTFALGFTSVGIVDSTEYDNLEVLQFNTEGSGSLLETFSRDSRGRSYILLFKEDTPGKVFATTTIGRHRLRLEFTYDNKDDKPRFQDVSLTMSHTSLSIDNNTLSFNLSSTLKNWNSSCPEGSGGYRCQVCQGGYFGRPKRNWPCRRCRCNGHSDRCRRRSGRCIGCGDNTKGRNCQFCADMYYGDAINDVCKSCDCNQDGSQDLTCNRESGQCNCHDGITNRTCNSCINEGFWGPKDGQCRNCTCVPDNTIECVQETGECVCREGWTGDNCSVQVSCPPLDGPDNGVIDCTGSVYGDTCSFTCDDGYELTGSDTRTCQSDGNWNGSEVECEQVTCPPLTTPDDGSYNCTMGGDGAHVVGDTCTLTCDDGFEPSDSISRQCDNDGSWSGSDPTCDRVSCIPLDGPDNGVIDCTGSVYGDTCAFTCDDGYELTGSDTRTCQSDGNWNGTEAECEQVLGITTTSISPTPTPSPTTSDVPTSISLVMTTSLVTPIPSPPPPTLIISGQVSGPDIGLPPVPVKITYLLDGSEDVQWEITVPEGVNLTNYGVLFPVSLLPSLQFLTTDESVNANFFNGLFSSVAMVTSNDTSFTLNITGTGLTTNGSITTVNFGAVAFGDFDLTTYPADLSTVSYSYYVEEDEPGRVIMSGNIGDDDIPLSVMFNYSPTTDEVPFDDRQFGIDQSNVSVEDDGSTLRFTSTSSLLRFLPAPAVCAAGNLTTPYINFTTIKAAREIVFEDDRPTLWQINIPSDSEVEEYYRIIPLLISPVSLAFSSDVVDVMGENFFVNATLQTGDHTFVVGFTSVGIVDSTEYDNLEVLQFNTEGSGSLLESFSRNSDGRSYTLLFKEDTLGEVSATTSIVTSSGRYRLRLKFTYDNKDDKPRFQDVSLTMSHTSLSIDNNTLSFNLSSTLKNWNSSCPEGSGGYRCRVCQGGYFGRPKRNWPCRRCRCNGHSDRCRRRSGRCIGCGDNTKGRNCQFCADMYYGDAINDVCKSCDCDQDGSQDLICNRESGQCNCHDGITNRTCNSCINEGFWGPKDGQCRNCTCVPDNTIECVQESGDCLCQTGWIGDNCSEADVIIIPVGNETLPTPVVCAVGNLTGPEITSTTVKATREIVAEEDRPILWTINVPSEDDLEEYYRIIPLLIPSVSVGFTSNIIDVIGDNSVMTVTFTYRRRTYTLIFTNTGLINSTELDDVEVLGFSADGSGSFRNAYQRGSDSDSFMLFFREESPGIVAAVGSRLRIEFSYDAQDNQTRFQNVSLFIKHTSLLSNNGTLTFNVSTTVEGWNSNCPAGSGGFRCGVCIGGYFGRPNRGRPCRMCMCNGHSNRCRRRSGRCINCADNTAGKNCEVCSDGFYGDAVNGVCIPCECDPEGSRNRQCNKKTGQCPCYDGITNRTCDTCIREGFWGPLNRRCRRCRCNPENTLECVRRTGKCNCRSGWTGNDCSKLTCPPLTTPDDGSYNCTMGGDGAHVVGDTCTLTCDDGFEPSDSISRQCDNDGSWSGSDPTCDRVSCPPLDGPDNGVIDCTGNVYGDTCSFTCDDGYELTGSDTRTCQSDGNWNDTEAECEQVLGITTTSISPTPTPSPTTSDVPTSISLVMTTSLVTPTPSPPPPTLIISGQVSGPDIGLPPVPVKITYLLDGSEDVQWEITVPEGVNLTNYGVLFPVSLLPSLQFLTTDESVNANFFNGLFSSVAMVTSNDTSFTLNITGTGLTTNGSITTVNFGAVAFGDFDLTTYPADLSTVSYSYYVEEYEPGRVIMSGNIGDDDIPLSVMFNYSPTTDEVPFDDRQFGIDQSNVSVEDDGSTLRFTSTSSLLRLLPTPAVCAAGNLTTPYIDFTTIKAAREIVFEDDRPTLWQINIPSDSEVEEYYRIIPLLISPVSLAFSSDVVDVMGENFFVNATLQTDDHTFVLGFTSVGIVDSTEYDNLEVLRFNTEGSGSLLETFSRDSRGRSYILLFKEDTPGKVFATTTIGRHRLRLEFTYDNKDDKPRFQDVCLTMNHTSLSIDNNTLSFNLSSTLKNWNSSCPEGSGGYRCRVCQGGYFGRPKRNRPCRRCRCNGHSDRCRRRSGRCIGCGDNTKGRNCQFCADLYYGDAVNDVCKSCDCDQDGSQDLTCNRESGQCKCHDGITNRTCNSCINEGFWGPKDGQCRICTCVPNNTIECVQESGDCLCQTGWIGVNCSEADVIIIPVGNETLPTPVVCAVGNLTGPEITSTTVKATREIVAEEDRPILWTINVPSEDDLEEYYRIIPLLIPSVSVGFTSNIIDVIGDDSVMTVTFTYRRRTYTLIFTNTGLINSTELDDVEVLGFSADGSGSFRNAYQRGSDSDSFTLFFREESPGIVSAVGSRLRIEFSYDAQDNQTRFQNVSMFIRHTSLLSNNGTLTFNVSTTVVGWNSNCPAGSGGFRCGVCIGGYFGRPNRGRPCRMCMCNGHSNRCRRRSGRCINCADNTAGKNCEVCADGFYGDAVNGVCIPCECDPEGSRNRRCNKKTGQCPCYDGITNRTCDTCIREGFWGPLNGRCRRCRCNPENTLECVRRTGKCNCRSGWTGNDCSKPTGCPEGASLQDGCTTCIDGYYGDPVNGKPCQKCICNNNIDLNVTGNCDTRNGNCLKCINNTTGNQCQVCADRFYGDAVNGTCLPCECDPEGSRNRRCNKMTGQCPCYDGITNRTCDTCIREGFWGPLNRRCRRCRCNPENTLECVRRTGKCNCRSGWTGDDCSKPTSCPEGASLEDNCNSCIDGFYGDPSNGRPCQKCICSDNIDLSVTGNCNQLSGRCLKCVNNTAGGSCAVCADGYYGNALNDTCSACDCHPIGSKGTSCNKNSGQCSCRRRVQGRTCDDCEPSFMLTTRGCRLCRCNKDGTVDGTTATCQIIGGQCPCKVGYEGMQCDIKQTTSDLRYNGNAYSRYMIGVNMVTSTQLVLSIKLENENGILFYVSQYENGTGDYFLAQFVNGIFEVSVRGGSTLTTTRGTVEITIDVWIRVVVVLRNGELRFTITPVGGSVPIDESSALLQSSYVGTSSILYVGGIPPPPYVSPVTNTNFSGCLRKPFIFSLSSATEQDIAEPIEDRNIDFCT